MDNDLYLKVNKRYLVETKDKNHYIGTYKEFVKQYGYIMYYVLDDVTNYHTNYCSFWLRKPTPEKLKTTAFFSSTDIFYDLEEIKENGKKARQNMEQRSLNMILHRLVNEHFGW